MSTAGFASTTVGYSLAAAAVTGEVLLFSTASDLINRISPDGARGLYAGVWGTQLAMAVITAPLLASWAIETGGDLLAAAAVLTAGLLGAALCLPLRALLHGLERIAASIRSCSWTAPHRRGRPRTLPDF
ncbi:hypothetical protein QFZ82_007594 [Streptomyces sp. V4I23]|uniref:hypothetical protein n=1 Tax=Streptomyces sp. V4I23 TaxID=3042282 RepID=UPI002787DD1F|nr:hypothetical protein [Streptomyces sp. V4I23]MDQ1013109.1 hypothetical protein [Streptomyces sp. V4I23]